MDSCPVIDQLVLGIIRPRGGLIRLEADQQWPPRRGGVSYWSEMGRGMGPSRCSRAIRWSIHVVVTRLNSPRGCGWNLVSRTLKQEERTVSAVQFSKREITRTSERERTWWPRFQPVFFSFTVGRFSKPNTSWKSKHGLHVINRTRVLKEYSLSLK